MRIHFFSVLVTVAASWLSITGCGSDDFGSTGNLSPEEEELEGFFDTLLPPFCEDLHACCTNRSSLALAFAGANPEECVKYRKEDWGLYSTVGDQIVASLKAGTTIIDHARLKECAAQFKTMAQSGDACLTPPLYHVYYSCLGAFRGQLLPGEACNSTDDYAPLDQSFMQCKAGRCDQGKCVPFLKTGDTCSTTATLSSSPDKLCNYIDSEWCQGLGEEGTCGPLGKIGAPCRSAPQNNYHACESHSCIDDKCAPLIQIYDACYMN